jgi:GntR family transcriptional repressor for pyruvate dehydrogenase complex
MQGVNVKSRGLDLGEHGSVGPVRGGGPAGDAGQGLPRHVASQIQSMIEEGKLKAGVRLPSQRDLSATLKVSRSVVREALLILEASGALRTEASRGTFVAARTEEEASPGPGVSIGRRPYSKLDICRFRHLVEGHSARLAAMQVTDRDLERLGANLALFKEQTRRGDFEASALTDLEFHHLIVELAGVPLFTDLHLGFRDLLHKAMKIPSVSRSRGWEPVVEHERIVDALRRRDPDEARYYMQSHLVRSAERLGILLANDIV